MAFLVVSQPGNATPVQELTGGEKLATGWRAAQLVQVIGYPDGRERPITCTARTRAFGRRQMEFDCGGYTDGTSGGPFLANVHRATGAGRGGRRHRRLRAGRGHAVGLLLGPVRPGGP